MQGLGRVQMFDEEDLPKPKNQPTPRVLDKLSVDELQDYIGWLEAEIARVRADMERKRNATKTAASLFKS